jgi:hypothetical protein
MAVADADYCFISVEFGPCCSSSNSNVFKNSKFGEILESNELNIQDPKVLTSDAEGLAMPFMLVGDEAFTLSDHVLRPYPNINLASLKLIYNYRLSTAQRIVECTFEILANKWRIFYRPIDVKPDFFDNIIKACCVLHNYVRKIMAFSSVTLGMNVPWNVYSLLEQEATLGAFLYESTSQSISLRHKGQFPGSMLKCNICFLPVRTSLSWK